MEMTLEQAREEFESIRGHYRPTKILGLFKREMVYSDLTRLNECHDLAHKLGLYSHKPEERKQWTDAIALAEEINNYKKKFRNAEGNIKSKVIKM
jgi:hypothetical protein